MYYRERSNPITGASAGGPRGSAMRTRWVARVAQCFRSASDLTAIRDYFAFRNGCTDVALELPKVSACHRRVTLTVELSYDHQKHPETQSLEFVIYSFVHILDAEIAGDNRILRLGFAIGFLCARGSSVGVSAGSLGMHFANPS